MFYALLAKKTGFAVIIFFLNIKKKEKDICQEDYL